MERIEIKTRAKIETYLELLDLYKDDRVFMKKVNDRLREIRAQKKNERLFAAKEREQRLEEERKRKNIEKMQKKQNVVADVNRRKMYRSPQPTVKVFKKKVEQTKEE